MTERLRDKPSTYKVWNQTPNPKTRHTHTDGQKVKLEEQFIVINDKTGDIDYVDYPGDWTCSPSNKENCLCNITFTNNPEGYVPHDKLKEEINETSNIIKIIDQNKKHLYELGLTSNAVEEIKNFTIKYRKETIEHGAIYSKNGTQLFYDSGTFGEIIFNFTNVSEDDESFSIHNHPIIQNVLQIGKGYSPPSAQDIRSMLQTKKEKYCVVINEKEIFVVKSPQRTYTNEEIEHVCDKIDNVYRKYDIKLRQELEEYKSFLDNNQTLNNNFKKNFSSRHKNVNLIIKIRKDKVIQLKEEYLKMKYRYSASNDILDILTQEELDSYYIEF
ncbi:MAG: hypothetical protein E7Z86_10330 [Methanosphaera stadtmanae]|nr:hypothetical protein [Methanosphaera stadtmanae]